MRNLGNKILVHSLLATSQTRIKEAHNSWSRTQPCLPNEPPHFPNLVLLLLLLTMAANKKTTASPKTRREHDRSEESRPLLPQRAAFPMSPTFDILHQEQQRLLMSRGNTGPETGALNDDILSPTTTSTTSHKSYVLSAILQWQGDSMDGHCHQSATTGLPEVLQLIDQALLLITGCVWRWRWATTVLGPTVDDHHDAKRCDQ